MDNHITRQRIELKYLIPPGGVDFVVNRIPAAESTSYRLTTLYVDRADRHLSRAAVETPYDCTKLRVREYRGAARLWVEVKSRKGAWSEKARFDIDRGTLPALLNDADLRDELIADHRSNGRLAEVLAAYRKLREVAQGRLLPVGVVTATRRVFSMLRLPLRFSVDQEITYYSAPEGLADGRTVLSADALGEPLRPESEAVLELKFRGVMPQWCLNVVQGLERTDYSKFRRLVRCLVEAREVA